MTNRATNVKERPRKMSMYPGPRASHIHCRTVRSTGTGSSPVVVVAGAASAGAASAGGSWAVGQRKWNQQLGRRRSHHERYPQSGAGPHVSCSSRHLDLRKPKSKKNT